MVVSSVDSKKYIFLDGLRGFAALLAVAQHAGFPGGYSFLVIGEFAVDVFFFLSAFLLTGPLYGQMMVSLQGTHHSRRNLFSFSLLMMKYSIRRVMRVYPLFVAILLLLQVAPSYRQGFFMSQEQFDFYNIFIFHPDYRFHVFWTLPIELFYYMCLPVLTLMLALCGKYWPVPTAGLLLYSTHNSFNTARGVHTLFMVNISTFLLGSCTAIIYYYAKTISIKNRRLVQIKECVMLILVLLIASQVTNHFLWSYFAKPKILVHEGSMPFTNIFLVPLFLLELQWPGFLTDILSWCVFTYAGKTCYGIYLLHSIPVYLLFQFKHDAWDRFFIIWFGTFLIATLSFYLIEYPCILLVNRICEWLTRLEGKWEADSPVYKKVVDIEDGKEPVNDPLLRLEKEE